MTRSVPDECIDPISTASPMPLAISSTRRRMKARIRISLSSASFCTSADQLLAIQLDDLAGFARAEAKQRAAPRDHVDLAAELSGLVDRHQRLGVAGNPHDLDRAGGDDQERHDLVAGVGQHLAGGDRALLAVCRDARDLGVGQPGEHVVDARSHQLRQRRSLGHVPSYSW